MKNEIKLKNIDGLQTLINKFQRNTTIPAHQKLTDEQCKSLIADMFGHDSSEDLIASLGIEKKLTKSEAMQKAFKSQAFSNQFLEASKRSKEKKETGDFEVSAPIPSVVLAAFSIEISFKSIIFSQKNMTGWGHDLHSLFQDLPLQLQNEIKDQILTAYPKFSQPGEFEKELHDLKNVFVNWRYFHEPKKRSSINLDLLIFVASVSQRIAMNLIPPEYFMLDRPFPKK